MTSTLLMVGTRKGLWLGTRSVADGDWSWTGPHLPMEEVYSVMLDRRGASPRVLAGTSSSWLGPQVWRSDDVGASWQETPNGAIRFPEDTGTTLARVWQLQPGIEDDVVWAGTEPGAVFRSADRGETFELVRALWDHPQRPEWGEGFGGQAFHTIAPHPEDPQRVLAAISTGGVYVTDDGGASWTASNQGVRAEFLPEDSRYPEFGQCVHKVARDPEDPDRLFLQNHGGVYRSDDGGASWVDIGASLPSDFGFVMATHPRRGRTAYCFPNAGGDGRWPPEGRARVFRTTDAGESWQQLGDGQLPDDYFTAVMRDAMCVDDNDPAGVYFGGRNGAVWGSPDEGDTWSEIKRNLPDVLVVRAATLV